MPSRITSVSLAAVDVGRIAAFWCSALGYDEAERDDELISIVGDGPDLDVLRVAEPKRGQNRVHLDLRAEGTTTAAELERLLALGATRVDVGQGSDVSWTVLADPEGNEFCLLSRSVEQVQPG